MVVLAGARQQALEWPSSYIPTPTPPSVKLSWVCCQSGALQWRAEQSRSPTYTRQTDCTGKQEYFFQSLLSRSRSDGKLFVLGGDFNCVLLLAFDRYHASRPKQSKPGSLGLMQLVERFGLIDSVSDHQGSHMSMDEARQYRADYFTFGSQDHGSD